MFPRELPAERAEPTRVKLDGGRARAFARRVCCCAWAVLLVGVMVSCRKVSPPLPRVGERCTELGKGSCLDAGTILTCRDYTWREDTCRGPKGCSGEPTATCDQTLAAAGDACDEDGARACSRDKRDVLRCTGAKMVPVRRCRGARGCEMDGTRARPDCDTGVIEVGDPCEDKEAHCTGKAILGCSERGHYVATSLCRGAHGCYRSPRLAGMICDDTLGDVGEACGRSAGWCSRDGKDRLECRSGTLAVQRHCATRCSVGYLDGDGYTVGCED